MFVVRRDLLALRVPTGDVSLLVGMRNADMCNLRYVSTQSAVKLIYILWSLISLPRTTIVTESARRSSERHGGRASGLLVVWRTMASHRAGAD